MRLDNLGDPKDRVWSLLSIVWKGVKFNLELAAYGLLVTFVLVAIESGRRFSSINVTDRGVNLTKNETIYAFSSRSIGLDFMGRFWEREFGRWDISIDFPLYFIGPVWIFFLLINTNELGWKLVLWIGQIVLNLCVTGFVFTNPKNEIRKFWYIAMFVQFFWPTICFRFALPKDCKIWKTSFRVGILGLIGIIVLFIFEPLITWNRLFFVCIVIPIIRETLNFVQRSAAFPIFMDEKRILGNSVLVRREYVWLLTLFIQAWYGIWSRLVVTTIRDPTGYIIYQIFTSVSELVVRLSISKRDKWFAKSSQAVKTRFFGGCCFRRKSEAVQPDSTAKPRLSRRMSASMEVCALNRENFEKMTKEEKIRQWFAFIILGEIISEYIGIFVSIGLVLLYRDAILILPLPLFGTFDDPFEGPLPVTRFLFLQFTQFASELIVDIVCFVIEEDYFQVPIVAVWREMTMKSRAVNLILASWLGLALSIAFIFNGTGGKFESDDMCPENTTFLCDCDPPSENLYGRYCSQLLGDTFH